MKYILLLLLFGSHISLFAQKHEFDSVQMTKLKDSINTLTTRLSKLEAKLDDSKLQSSINTAESLISKQNILINDFGVLYSVISVLIVVVTLFTYFLNIRPAINRAEKAVSDSENAVSLLNTRIDNINQIIEDTLNKKFIAFEAQSKAQRIDQIFIDLLGNFPNQKRLALEQIANVPVNEIDNSRVQQLFEFLNNAGTTEEEKLTIVEVLVQKNSTQIKTFLKNWSNVQADNRAIKNTLVKYYTENGFNEFLQPIMQFITDHATPHLEFIAIAEILASLHRDGLITIINYDRLVNRLSPYEKKQICNTLNYRKKQWGMEEEINQCLVCKSISS